ncbi:MAG: D-alanyl-D-alanine carboxypeptidase family protein [Acidimicrobiales bacterium]
MRPPVHLRRPARPVLRAAVVLVALCCPFLPTAGASPLRPKPSAADSKLRELQAKRDQIRAAKAKSASNVNALKASDADIQAALTALGNDIDGQSDLLEESQRAVTAAEADQAAAQAAEAKAEAELAQLKVNIKKQAVDAYINAPDDQTLQLLSAESLADAARERTMRDVQAANGLDAAERYRAVQEDLGIAREQSAAAAAKANRRRTEVSQRLARLEKAQAEQAKFSDEVEARIEASLAEADSLAQLDGALSSEITNRQVAIANQLAAQRASAARRGRSTPTPSGGSAISYPNTNGAGIVTVRGIRVDQSIAGNLERLLAAAEASGITLSGGGYRDPAAQIATRRNNCGSSNYAIYQAPASSCHPPTARPGTSMHERGLAIDFTQGGGTLSRGSSGFAWMRANAAQYGFYNLPSEPWHWSTNGN